jgi:hypothetical protein
MSWSAHLPGLLVIAAVALAWTAVQHAWKRTFPERCADPDALSGRIGCHGSDCSNDCDRRGPRRAGSAEEDKS